MTCIPGPQGALPQQLMTDALGGGREVSYFCPPTSILDRSFMPNLWGRSFLSFLHPLCVSWIFPCISGDLECKQVICLSPRVADLRLTSVWGLEPKEPFRFSSRHIRCFHPSLDITKPSLGTQDEKVFPVPPTVADVSVSIGQGLRKQAGFLMYVLWRWLSQVSRNSLNLHHECKQRSAKHSWQMNLDFFWGGGLRLSENPNSLISLYLSIMNLIQFQLPFSHLLLCVTSSTRAFPEVKNFVCPNSLQRDLLPLSFSLHGCLVASPLSKFKKKKTGRFIKFNKCPVWWGMFIMVEVMHVWGQGAYGKSLYLPLNFAVNQQFL